MGNPFKSVKDLPPDDFLEQFGKDLANPDVSDLSQLKWVFDGKKVSQGQLTSAIKKAIEEWNVPEDVLKNWGYEAEEGIRFKKDKLFPNIELIFNAK